MDTAFVGIDPGLGGAIAFVWGDGTRPLVFDTPTLEVKRGRSVKRIHNEAAMAGILRECSNAMHATIEAVHAMPGNGLRQPSISSMFNFGQGYGTWLGILAALGIAHDRVPPRRWKEVMLAGLIRGEKDNSRMRALQLWPALADELKRKKDDGRAEALLLAEYGRRLAGGAA